MCFNKFKDAEFKMKPELKNNEYFQFHLYIKKIAIFP